jgi:hypothetical protein
MAGDPTDEETVMTTTHRAPRSGTSDDDLRSTCEHEATQLIRRVNLRLKRLHDMGAHPGAEEAPAAQHPDPALGHHPADPD